MTQRWGGVRTIKSYEDELAELHRRLADREGLTAVAVFFDKTTGELKIDGYPITHPDAQFDAHLVSVRNVCIAYEKMREWFSQHKESKVDKNQIESMLTSLTAIAAFAEAMLPVAEKMMEAMEEAGGGDTKAKSKPKAETAAQKKKRLAAEAGDNDEDEPKGKKAAPTKDDVREALTACSEEIGRDDTLAVLSEFADGSDALDEVSRKDYADLIAALEKAAKGEEPSKGKSGW